MANADGSNARQITSLGGANFAPVFTPDGRKIIFSSNYENPRSGEFDLFLINPDGTGLEQVTTHRTSTPSRCSATMARSWSGPPTGISRGPGETNLFIADWVE